MDLKPGEVFGRTWKIGWNYRTLWWVGLLPGFFTLLAFPVFTLLNPLFTFLQPAGLFPTAFAPLPVPLAALLLVVVLFAYLCLMALVQAATMLGALRMEKGARRLGLRDLLERTLTYYWSVLGLYLLFWGARLLAMMCMTPMLLLLAAAWLVAHGLVELAQASMLADDLNLWEAVQRAGHLFLSNVPALLLFMLLAYLGVGLITSVFILPVVPGLLAGTWLTEASRGLADTLPGLFVSAFPPVLILLAFFLGMLMVFFQTAWAVACTRLAKQDEHLSNSPSIAA
ncbi:MAG TPA: hypothetical protein VIU39_00930 [Anaerolineales bacterium]